MLYTSLHRPNISPKAYLTCYMLHLTYMLTYMLTYLPIAPLSCVSSYIESPFYERFPAPTSNAHLGLNQAVFSGAAFLGRPTLPERISRVTCNRSA